ncbi:ricin-type beta-trefoil lectin domain protein [Microbispora sp. GKU 823]|uniref:ricin-type beta-trefoil lectin domain protein n=1 Tax=Microbispora sp. GKU 823 TaxID=1652100 RepID=UPI0009A403D2|nr:ricin-type beta-trefoil lectin domain protein [Microbispora sp. GKU 823]OPG14293.1 glycosyl hydrolase [Microbispora sp. GKU 823]
MHSHPRNHPGTHAHRRSLAGALTALAFVSAGVLAGATPAAADTSQFKGVNWADPRDNYADDAVIPSGLSASDSYATVKAKADAILTGFQNNLGANTVRLPVNPYSVGTGWWNSYTGAIDAATAKGFKVVLAYWEGPSAKDGRIDDVAAWTSMWNTVTARYGGNGLVYFEPMNEPFGYGQSAWADVAAGWIGDHPSIPKNRIFVSGTGYNDNVTSVCADSRLNGTFLSLHHYGFWGTHTYNDWVTDFRNRIGSCASRTVVDEMGAPMTTGLNYNDANSTDNFVRYLRADTDTIRSLGMGAIYWPGLRNGDPYTLQTLQGSGVNLTLSTPNSSGVDRIRYAWGSGSGGASVLRGVPSNRCLDVPGSSQANGTQVTIYDCNGGANQQWTATASGELRVYGNKCLDAYGQGTSPGTVVDVWDCNGGANQQWTLNSNGTVTGRQSGLCLDVNQARTANGTPVILWTCNGGANQQWKTT